MRDASTNNLVVRIKWCRANLGERGKDWDFMGGSNRVEICIYKESLASFYQLTFEFFKLKFGINGKELPDEYNKFQ
jgi:hypothetical protein